MSAARAQADASERNKGALKVDGLGSDVTEGGSIQPSGLGEKPAEKQDGQNHNYCDDDDLD